MPTVFRLQGTINSAQGPALSGVTVYVCTQPAVTTSIPPSPLASIFSDNAGANPINQSVAPIQTDGLGNWFCYATTGVYTVVFFDPIGRMPTTIFPDQQVVSPGGGSVTSIGLTMPAEFTVSGSPISSSGTLAVTKANQNANLVYAGPSSGGAAAPGFRALVSADLPAGVGTVTSVTLGVSAGALFTASITGTNPITGAGTFTLNLNFANQNANTVLAGPASGGAGAVTARALVAADLAVTVPTSFAATPVFNAGTAAMPTFTMTLTGNVTSSSVTNASGGQIITFVITQDGTGGRTFAWPPNFRGAAPIAPDATLVSVQSFVYDGTNWRANGPGLTMAA
jgi:hypothetical protein